MYRQTPRTRTRTRTPRIIVYVNVYRFAVYVYVSGPSLSAPFRMGSCSSATEGIGVQSVGSAYCTGAFSLGSSGGRSFGYRMAYREM